MKLDTLYKRTATGAIQSWVIEVDEETGNYRTISGQLEGAKVTSAWTVPKPKNAGRANATTPAVQGLAEAKSEWAKKVKKGYLGSVEEAKASTAFKPMLAKNYSDPKRQKEAHAAADKRQLYSQPKLDGARASGRLDGEVPVLISRQNTPIVSMPHITRALTAFFAIHPKIILDGELYTHALREDFDSLMSLIRKEKNISEDDVEAAKAVQYHIYDCYDPDRPKQPYLERFGFLFETFGLILPDDPRIDLVETTEIQSVEDIDVRYEAYLAAGYEGQMLRLGESPYEPDKRSSFLLKRKEFQDAEFEVLGIEEGVGNRAGQAGFVRVKERHTGKTFKAGIKGDLTHRIELLTNSHNYVGGEVTLHFNGRTPDGIPRFPRTHAWYPGGRDL